MKTPWAKSMPPPFSCQPPCALPSLFLRRASVALLCVCGVWACKRGSMNVYTSVRANVHLIFSFVLWLSRSLTRKQTTKTSVEVHAGAPIFCARVSSGSGLRVFWASLSHLLKSCARIHRLIITTHRPEFKRLHALHLHQWNGSPRRQRGVLRHLDALRVDLNPALLPRAQTQLSSSLTVPAGSCASTTTLHDDDKSARRPLGR